MKKVIVIGLDGLEPTIVEAMLAAGELPNLAALRDRGSYARIATTAPAQTPVAWSTFATGTNPGAHGIFDFLRRDPKSYLPDLALNRYERKNAFTPPKAVNLRRGTPLWTLLGDAGIPSTVVRCPCTYPPDAMRGRMLSGMGVPDLRGGLGTPTYYTTREGVRAGESENLIRLKPEADGSYRTYVVGPRNPADRTDVRVELTVRPAADGRAAVLNLAGMNEPLRVERGRWSAWMPVKFRLGMLQSVSGRVRWLLVRGESDFALYASPINFDPDAPLFPISEPRDYAAELARDIGPYYTTGMVEDHTGLNNGRFDVRAFLDQCEEVWDERRAMLLRELDRFDRGFLFCLFDTPDRVQHMLWRFREADHPANRGEPPDPTYARTIEDHYRLGDEVVGQALARTDDETLLVVLSDHGFNSFRRGVHLNGWLHQQGLLALKSGLRPGPDAGDLLQGIDWDRTRAYAVGLGGIYLNIRGREARGIVPPDEADRLKTEIARGMTGLRDPADGVVAVRSVRTSEELYRGAYATEAPDLTVFCERGYRASWESSGGGVPEGLFADNTHAWAGDHIIDPALVPGVLFANRGLSAERPRLEDLAPTILDALGVPKGPAMEGSSLLR